MITRLLPYLEHLALGLALLVYVVSPSLASVGGLAVAGGLYAWNRWLTRDAPLAEEVKNLRDELVKLKNRAR